MPQLPINTTTFKLNNGTQIPAVGLGTWQGQPGTDDAATLKASLIFALKSGYRLIDTAQGYGVESVVGSAIRESGIPRSEITVITKFGSLLHHDPAAALQKSLTDLDVEYIDIFLMHWPVARTEERYLRIEESPTFVETWRLMEGLIGEKCRGIGVSNFTQKLLGVLLSETKVVPLVNQVELHVFNPNFKLDAWCRERGIHVMSWSTLGGNLPGYKNQIITHPQFQSIAAAHSISIGVVSLSWAVQRGITVIPKSSKDSRLLENIRTVTLTDSEMEIMNNAYQTIERVRLSDYIPGLTDRSSTGVKSIMGWTMVEFGFEDENGVWLT